MNVDLQNAMLCWDSDTNRAKVVPHPDRQRISEAFEFSTGACSSEWKGRTEGHRLAVLMIDAWQAVVRDGVSAETMHDALLAIPEFRAAIAADVRGSSNTDTFA